MVSLAPRWRKILRDLIGNKTRTALVVLSIAVGVFAVGMIVASQIILNEDLTAQYMATNPSSAVIYTSPFNEELVTAVRGTAGVGEAEGRRRATLRLQVAGEWKTLRIEAVENYEKIRLNRIDPVAGAWPPRLKELLVERASLPLTGARIGDVVVVETPDGKTRALRLAGTVHDLNKPPPVFTGTPYGYVSFDTMEWLGFPRSANELHIGVASGRLDKRHIKAVTDEVISKVERGGFTVFRTFIPDPGKHPSDASVQPMLLILGVLGALSTALSAFLVINTISALLAQQVRQIGVMKAIGGRTRQIAAMYLVAVLLFGGLSLLVAVPLGAVASFLFTRYMAGLLNFDVGFRLPLEAVALEIAIGLTVPVAAAIVPVVRGVRVTVREALQSAGGAPGFGGGRVDRLLQRVRGVSRPTLLSLRNTFRRKARLGLTLVTLTLGGAIFIAVLTVHTSFLATLDGAFDHWNYDVDVTLSRRYRVDQIQEALGQINGVVAAETWSGGAARRLRPDGSTGSGELRLRPGPEGQESDLMRMLAVPAQTRVLRPQIIEGRWLLPDDANAVVINTDVLRSEPDVAVGSIVRLRIDAREHDWTVVGIAKSALAGAFLYVNYPYFAELTNSVGRAGNVEVVLDRHDQEYQREMAARIKDHLESVGIGVAATQTLGAIRAQAESQIGVLTAFLAVMAVILAVVGGLGLMGTMSINVLERSREIGVMRAIGAADGSVLRIFLYEGVLIGLISWVLGALLALPIGRLLSDAVGVAFVQEPLVFEFALTGAGLWLLLVVVLATAASLWPSIRASRMSVREVLAYE